MGGGVRGSFAVGEAWIGMRVDRWVHEHYPQLKHSAVQEALRRKLVAVRRAETVQVRSRCDPGYRLGSGDVVEVYLPDGLVAAVSGDADPLPPLSSRDESLARSWILYEDDGMVAINKPPGLAVQGGPSIRRHLGHYLPAFRSRSAAAELPRLVHRIDQEASGVLLLARTRLKAQELTRLFRERSLEKTYWAVVVGSSGGVPAQNSGRMRLPLAKRGHGVVPAPGGGEGTQVAETVFDVRERAGPLAWMELRPETGRKHQLRVQCASVLNAPILGDRKYDPENRGLRLSGLLDQEHLSKLHLHCRSLKLPHPTGASGFGELCIMAAPPEHMVAVAKALQWQLPL